MLIGLKSSLKIPATNSVTRKPPQQYQVPIIRPKSPPPPPPEAHFVTPSSPPTDLVTQTQLKEGGKKQESLQSADLAGMADSAASRVFTLNAPVSHEEKDAYAAARRFFDAREFDRAVFTLYGHKSDKSRFLSCYCLYLVCSPISYSGPIHEWYDSLGSRKRSFGYLLQA